MRFYIASIFLTIFVVHTKQGKVNISPKKELEIVIDREKILALTTYAGKQRKQYFLLTLEVSSTLGIIILV